jgi:hypothetical protein
MSDERSEFPPYFVDENASQPHDFAGIFALPEDIADDQLDRWVQPRPNAARAAKPVMDEPGPASIAAMVGEVARVTGLEPAASGVTGRRSNQLSYTRAGCRQRSRGLRQSAETRSETGKQEVARVTGLEPAASGVTGRRSNQLSYTRIWPLIAARRLRYPLHRGLSTCIASGRCGIFAAAGSRMALGFGEPRRPPERPGTGGR